MRNGRSIVLFAVALVAAAQTADSQWQAKLKQSEVEEIDKECQTNAGGDWRHWFDSLTGFRKLLVDAMDRETRFNVRVSTVDTSHHSMTFLKAEGKPPQFAAHFAGFYLAPQEADPFRWAQEAPSWSVLRATQAWLKAKGIDLIILPVPTVVDIYPDRIIPTEAPASLLVQPHLRKAFRDQISSGLNVIDLLPKFLAGRRAQTQPLFLVGDTHWGPVSWKIAASAIKESLAQYPFVVRAGAERPQFRKAENPRPSNGTPSLLWEYLSPEERTASKPFLTPPLNPVSLRDGKVVNPETAPVVLIGDSFTPMLVAPLAMELNVPIASHHVDGASIQPLKELLRNPKILSEAKVVVWVMGYTTLFLFDWSGLPEVISREGGVAVPKDVQPPVQGAAGSGPSISRLEERIERSTLASGMRVALLPKQTRASTVHIVVNIRYGNADTLVNRASAARLTPMLLMRGTRSRGEDQIAKDLAAAGAQARITGSGAVTTVNLQAPRGNLKSAVALLADILQSPSFPEPAFLKVRGDLIASLKAAKSQPQVQALNLLERLVHPYSKGDIRATRDPSEEAADLEKLTLDDVKQFHSRNFGSSYGEFVAVGDFDSADLLSQVKTLFGSWKSQGAYAPLERAYKEVAPVNRSVETPDASNALLVVGRSLPIADSDENYGPLLVANRILGGNQSTRLPVRLRAAGATAIVGSRIAPMGVTEGSFLAYAVGPAASMTAMEKALLDELDRVADQGFTAQEVEAAKAEWLKIQQAELSIDENLVRRIAANETLHRSMSWDLALENRVANLTPAQVKEACVRYLKSGSMTVVKAGDFQPTKKTPK